MMRFMNRGPRPLIACIASKPVEISCPACFTRFEVFFSELASPVRLYKGVCPKCGAHTITEISTRLLGSVGETSHVTRVEKVVQ